MKQPATHLPTNVPDLLREIRETCLEPEKWLRTPNDQLGGREPNDLLGTPDEPLIRDLIRSIQHGMLT